MHTQVWGKIYVFSDLTFSSTKKDKKLISVDKVSQLLYFFFKKNFFSQIIGFETKYLERGKWDGERNQITTSSLRDFYSLNIRGALFTFSSNLMHRKPARQTYTNSNSRLKMHFRKRFHFRCKSSYFHPTKGGDLGVTTF